MWFENPLRAAARAFAVIVASCLMASCASPDVLSEQAASRIRTIALLQIAEPQVDLIENFGKRNESHSSVYSQMLVEHDVHLSALLAEALARRLGDSGYRVTYLALGDAAGYSGALASDSQSARADADAILVVHLNNVSYVSPDRDTALQPWAVADVQLFDARTGELIYTRSFNAGYAGASGKSVRLPVDPHYRYLTAGELESKFDDSSRGLKDAMLAIAGAVGEDFAIGTRPIVRQAPATAEPAAPPETTADRDREAAAAMAAQWEASTPPPAAPAAAAANVDAAAATLSAMAADAYTADGVDGPTAPVPASEATPTPGLEPEPVAPPAEAVPELAAAPPPSEPVAPPVAAAPTPAVASSVILSAEAPVRAQPTTIGAAIAVLPAGTPVSPDPREIHNPTGDWRYITSGTVSGWIAAGALPH
jgi:hypothetical protein